MANEERKTRDEKIMVRLTEQVKNDLAAIAQEMGISVSALAAYVLGDYVRRTKWATQEVAAELVKSLVERANKEVPDEFIREVVSREVHASFSSRDR
jgi:antitoxin component of RelBE/YafQ-DinJ toxin-antitoxin module